MNFKPRNPVIPTDDAVKEYCAASGQSEQMARLLISRGISREDCSCFLSPEISMLNDPFCFNNMKRIVTRIKAALKKRERIAVYSDYDTDGICGAAILHLCFKKLGVEPLTYIPDRFSEGYGTNPSAIRYLAAEDTKLLICVDCGIRSVADARLAAELGIEMVILDHHEPGELPDTPYIIDAKIETEKYPFKELCGGALAFKLACALLGQEAFSLIDIAAIATIGDLVPLVGENRVIAALGLKALRENIRIGVDALLSAAGLNKERLSARDVSFGIVPRLNAAGRMELADIGYKLLICEDKEEAELAAEHLNQINIKRQERQRIITDAASLRIRESGELYKKGVLVVSGKDWDKGVVGLAAGALAERFNRPAIVFSEENGIYTGSARSIQGIDIYDVLNSEALRYTRFGGHEQAAGLTIAKEHFGGFEDALNAYILKKYPESVFTHTYLYDLQLRESELGLSLAKELELLEPTGMDNPPATVMISSPETADCLPMGTGRHFKLLLRDSDAECVAFYQEPKNCDIKTIAGELGINEFRGNVKAQLVLRAVEYAPPALPMREHKKSFIKEASAFYSFLQNKEEYHYVGEEEFFERLTAALSGSSLGTLAITNSPWGADKLLGFAVKTSLQALVCGELRADTAENAICYTLNGLAALSKNFRDIFAIGAFAAPATQNTLMLYSDELCAYYKEEAAAYFADKQLLRRIYLMVKEAVLRESQYDSFAELGKRLGVRDEKAEKKLWFAINVFYQCKLLDIKKSDKILFNVCKNKAVLEDCPLYMSFKTLSESV